MQTAETAPLDRPILVWVRGVSKDRVRGGWRAGRCHGEDGLPKKLFADGYNGDWEIPYWMDYPPPPAGEL